MVATLKVVGTGVAVVLASLTVSAQTAPANKDMPVKLIGCVEMEKDYRARMDAKPGGVLGSGVGVSNEFMLVGAMEIPAAGARARGPVGTSGTAGDYSLTGKAEPQLVRQIGRQIEVLGIVLPMEAHDSAEDARDRLPRLSITAWHPMADYCPAK